MYVKRQYDVKIKAWVLEPGKSEFEFGTSLIPNEWHQANCSTFSLSPNVLLLHGKNNSYLQVISKMLITGPTDNENSLNETYPHHYYHYYHCQLRISLRWDLYMFTEWPGLIHSSGTQRWLWHVGLSHSNQQEAKACYFHQSRLLSPWFRWAAINSLRQLPGSLAPAFSLRQKLVILPSPHH